MPSLRGVEADVDEIKLKDSFCESSTKRTSSFAKALKKRISLSKLPKLSPEVEKAQFPCYPTFTIEDWEQSVLKQESQQSASNDSKYNPSDNDIRRQSDQGNDAVFDFSWAGIDDDRGLDGDDCISIASEQPSRLSIDSSMVQSGRARFYKRLSICDLKESYSQDGHTMDPKERVFLEAAERGDKHTMMRCLAPPYPVNVNCTDILGRTAIQIAVDNENVEIVELLLQQETIRIGDALLYAITEGVYKIVEMLINHPSIPPEMLATDWGKIRSGGEESSDFDPNISPIILAAHCNQFEILQLFLSRGAYIDKPHSLSCSCRQCTEGFHIDSLRYSLKRIHTFRALASPAWISLTSEDPILAAFKLSWELDRLARLENEFKDTYMELSEMCKKYTCDLLHQCRSTREVIAVLNRRTDYDDITEEDANDDDPSKLTLSRLKLALKYNQKQFVAHPNCQQLLTSVWYEGLPVWRRRNAVIKICICVTIIFFIPVIAVIYLMFPRTKIGKVLRSPFMKFIYHSASFGLFLVLLVLASTRSEGSERKRRNIRGPGPTVVEWLICFWVFGMVWAECKQLWEEGLKAYSRQWWNWLDFIMLSLYLSTFSLRAAAFGLVATGNYGPREMARTHWPGNDPTLIAEGVFAVANVFSFARIIYLFQTNPHLGPLQISLGCMIIDIAKFLFIFFLVLTSFACGLNQLYWYYDPTENCSEGLEHCRAGSAAFNTLDETFSTLFWSLFGISSPKSTELSEEHAFIESVGQGLFMAYHVMSIIVLINMLIAMMSSSFQQIEDHADQEWKFARSKLWMSYFDQGSTLPAPFNLVISPKAVFYGVRGTANTILDFVSCICRISNKRNTIDKGMLHGLEENHNLFLKGPNASNKSRQTRRYADVMRRLVSRYIHQAKKQLRQDGVNEDDLLEIKQDISSLRYELREDRKREAARAYGQIDSIKKDILRLLRHNKINGNGPPAKADPSNPTDTIAELPNKSDDVAVTGTLSKPKTVDAEDTANEASDSIGKPSASKISQLQTQKSVDLGVLGRDPKVPHVDITVTPASSLPCNLTYSQGNLSGCLLAPQEMDYLRKEIVHSVRSELRELMRDALESALCPTVECTMPNSFSPTPTPWSTPNTTEVSYSPSQTNSFTKPKISTYSRAPTLEVSSSPMLSPISSSWRVPKSSSQKDVTQSPHSLHRDTNSDKGQDMSITTGDNICNQVYTDI